MILRTGKIVSIQSRGRFNVPHRGCFNIPRRGGFNLQGRGFTLIELTLVAVIILVLVVLSSPKFRGTFTSLQIDDAAQRMAQVIRYGQQRAIVEEGRFRLSLDSVNGAYRLLSESRDTDGLSVGTAAAFDPIEGRFSDVFTLPDGVAMVSAVDKIDFYPDGRSAKVTINLSNQDGRKLTMRTTGRAGYVEILEDVDK